MHAFLYKGNKSHLFSGDGSDADYELALKNGWTDAPEPIKSIAGYGDVIADKAVTPVEVISEVKAVDEKVTEDGKQSIEKTTKPKKINIQ